MTYVSLYRKWRPQTFADVVGQTHVVRTLGNALAEKRIAHAYLFAGPRGTGKTTLARLLAKGLNCVNGPTSEPCGVCSSCERVAQGMAMDVVEIDGASNRGIDEMRDVRERVRFSPSEGAYKVYIIDEVHMLTTEAFNALLKVLEEPPAHVVFVFATTEPHKIPTTVTSRCQRFDFRRLAADDAVARLRYVASQEGIEVTPEALDLIVRYADGSLRDGLGILDQARAYSEAVTDEVITDVLGVAPREQIEAFATVLAKADTPGGLSLVKNLQAAGRDLRQFLRDVSRYLRDVLLYSAGGIDALRHIPGEEQLAAIQDHAASFSSAALLRAIDVLGEAEGAMRLAARSHLPLEMAIIRLTAPDAVEARPPNGRAMHGLQTDEASPSPSADVQELGERVARLEATIARLQQQLARAPAVGIAHPAGSVDKSVTSTSPSSAAGQNVQTVDSPPEAVAGSPEPPSAPGRATPPRTGRSPKVTVPTTADGDALTAVREQWDNLLERLRQEKALTVQAFLREGKLVAMTGDVLTIEFPGNRGFHRANVAEPSNAKIIEQILRGLLGRPVKIEPVLEGEYVAPPAAHTSASQEGPRVEGPPVATTDTSGTRGASTDPPGRSDGPRTGAIASEAAGSAPDDVMAKAAKDPLVRGALELFGGKIVDVQPSGPSRRDEQHD